MARRRRSAAVRTIVQRSPAPVIRVSAPAAPRRRFHRTRRIAGRAVGIASSEKHTLVALGAAAVLGYAEKQAFPLPSIGPLGPASTTGLIAWAIGRATRSTMAAHVATGLLSVGLYKFAAGQTTGFALGDAGTMAAIDDD